MTNLVKYKQDASFPGEFQKCCYVRKSHQESNPGGHSFSVLSLSIGKKSFSLSQVVTYKSEAPPESTPDFYDSFDV